MEATEKPVAIKWSPDGCGWAGFSEMRSSPRSRFYVVGPTRSMLRGVIFHSFLFPRDLQLPKDKRSARLARLGVRYAAVGTLLIYADEHDRQGTQRTLADLVARQLESENA